MGLAYLLLVTLPPTVHSFSNGQIATEVIGQSSFDGPYATQASRLNGPNALAFDAGGNLWVVDNGDNRILEYNAPLTADESASLVIGQSTYNTNSYGRTATALDGPSGLAFDSNGNLWVADTYNNRVLKYTAPLSTGESASVVIGQPSFSTVSGATSPSRLNLPSGLRFDSSGNLWVAD